MKKLLLISFVSLVLWVSCRPVNNSSKEPSSAPTVNTTIVQQLEQADEVKKQLEQENKALKRLIPLLSFSSQSILTDTLSQHLFENLIENAAWSESATGYQFLYELSLLANPNRNGMPQEEGIQQVVDEPHIHSYLHYLWSSIDRRDNSLFSLFERFKPTAIHLLLSSGMYAESGLERTIKLLKLTYNETHNNTDLLEDLYQRTDSVGVLQDRIYQEIASEKAVELASEFRDYEFVSYLPWAYSFWARRYHEDNIETVYELLVEFDDEMQDYLEDEW